MFSIPRFLRRGGVRDRARVGERWWSWGKKRVQTGSFSGGAPRFARRGGAHPAKLQFFLGRAVRRGAFFRPLPTRGAGRRTATAQRVRVTRASGVFRLFAFTSSPFACKMLSVSVLRVKASPLVCSRLFTHNRLKQRMLRVKASPCAPVFTAFGYFCLRSLRGGERCGG